jgi:hypothetical protein
MELKLYTIYGEIFCKWLHIENGIIYLHGSDFQYNSLLISEIISIHPIYI